MTNTSSQTTTFELKIGTAFYCTKERHPQSDHWHVCIPTESPASIKFNGRDITFFPERFYLIPPNKQLEMLEPIPDGILAISFEMSLPYNTAKLPYFEGDRSEVEMLLPPLIKELSSVDTITSPKGYALCSSLCGLIVSELPFDGKSFSPMIENMIIYIKENYKESVNIKELAEQNGYCQDVFIRKFKAYTGLTPYNYLCTEKINYTKELLAQDQLQLEEIASLAGFHDQAHFTRLFKKYTKLTPAKYRRKLRKKR